MYYEHYNLMNILNSPSYSTKIFHPNLTKFVKSFNKMACYHHFSKQAFESLHGSTFRVTVIKDKLLKTYQQPVNKLSQ